MYPCGTLAMSNAEDGLNIICPWESPSPAIFCFTPPQCIIKIQFRRRSLKLAKAGLSTTIKSGWWGTGLPLKNGKVYRMNLGRTGRYSGPSNNHLFKVWQTLPAFFIRTLKL
jgi:hypothetical protein